MGSIAFRLNENEMPNKRHRCSWRDEEMASMPIIDTRLVTESRAR